MKVWKEAALSIIGLLGMFNDFVGGAAHVGKMFKSTCRDAHLEQQLEAAATTKRLVKEYDISEEELAKIEATI